MAQPIYGTPSLRLLSGQGLYLRRVSTTVPNGASAELPPEAGAPSPSQRNEVHLQVNLSPSFS